MKKILSYYTNSSLVLRILIGMGAGILLGLSLPQAQGLSMLGDLFVGALRAIAPLLVFVLIIGAICQTKQGQKTNMSFIILLYILGNLLAAMCAALASYAFPVSMTLNVSAEAASSMTAPSGIEEVLQNLLMNIVANPIESLANGNYIGLLVWSALLGVALRAAGDKTKAVVADIANALTTVVRWIIQCAPFGILGLVYTAIAQQGLSGLANYGELILLLVGTMAFVLFVLNPVIVFFCIRRNPYPLVFTCLRDSFIPAFFTRSSAANIPVNLALCKRLRLNPQTYSVSIPLGATINMAGAAVTISTMTLAATHTLGISVDVPTAIILCVLSAISAAGTSGVTGGSLLLIPMACSLFGIPNEIAMQVVGVGFIISVIQDSCETGLNSSTDVLYTAAADYREQRLHPERYKQACEEDADLVAGKTVDF